MLLKEGIVVVGVSGVTCGGKSTIATNLQKAFEKKLHCIVIGVDDYYKDEEEIRVDTSTGLQEWDVMDAFHMDKLHSDVQSHLDRLKKQENEAGKMKAMLIIEGIVIFNDGVLGKLFDKRYFMTLSYEITKERRRKRVYEPPEVPELFDGHVWPKYIEYRDRLRMRNVDMTELDAARPIEDVMQFIFNDLEKTFGLASLVK